MKKIKLSLSMLAIAFGLMPCALRPAMAADTNPFMGTHKNQIMLNLGQGFNNFGLIPSFDMPVPFNMIQLTYSQPAEFFRLPARINVVLTERIGYGQKYSYSNYDETFIWDWTAYSGEQITLTEDFALYHNDHWYFGAGVGIGMQGQQNEREGSKLIFSFKMFAGYNINDNWNMELFAQHYSNGDAGGDANYSYNFMGIGVGYNF